MNIKSIIITAAAGITLAACQSNTYHILGTVENATEGDTLFLTTDLADGTPRDTVVVKDGKFELSGETDSTYFCIIYSSSEQAINIPLFVEPGTIRVKLSKEPGASRVGGTAVNDEWQRMCDSTMVIGKEINNIAERVFSKQDATEEDQAAAMEQIDKLNQRHAAVVLQFAERNIKNELGYFLLTMYPDEIISAKDRQRLIQQMPAEMRQRQDIKDMEQQISNAAKTDEGATITDFSMPTIEGAPLSIMSEIAKNRITVIDFWASWCAPCRQETPLMIEIYKQYKDKGLGFVGISLDDDADAWKKATKELGIPWPQMSDLQGWDNAAARMFNVTSIPHTVVVDQNGKILRRGLRAHELSQFLAEGLK